AMSWADLFVEAGRPDDIYEKNKQLLIALSADPQFHLGSLVLCADVVAAEALRASPAAARDFLSAISPLLAKQASLFALVGGSETETAVLALVSIPPVAETVGVALALAQDVIDHKIGDCLINDPSPLDKVTAGLLS